MANRDRPSLEQRAQRAMLENAFLRWESAVVIGLTLILAVLLPQFTPLPAWALLLGGGIAEALLAYSSFSDPETGRRVVANMLRSDFHPERLRDEKLQAQMAQALDYRSRITAAIRERGDSVLKENLLAAAHQMDDWLESIYNLAGRIDRYRTEKDVLERDRRRAAERLQQLQADVRQEADSDVRADIERAIAHHRHQIETIDTLDNTMERAELQLETTLSSLGTIYSQTMLVGAKDIDSGRAKRLRQDIA
ncbi:MAG: hypothetical protein ACRDHL_03915, partial [Candidatus Promineifilaceae bacterium]